MLEYLEPIQPKEGFENTVKAVIVSFCCCIEQLSPLQVPVLRFFAKHKQE